jgi:GDSL-like Lipase/Acylhydrolase family
MVGRMFRRPTLVRLSANVALVLVSLLVGYLILESVFFRLLRYADFGIRPHLPAIAGVLVQGSKQQFVPKYYLAILGDSYAEGAGDWLWNNAGNEALPFGPADVLHELTGRDVVSFGRGGSSSAEGLVKQPAEILAASTCSIFPTISEPAHIMAFFYAGNDIQDNLRFLGQVRTSYGVADANAVDRYLSERYASFPFWKCHLYLGDTIGRMAQFASSYHGFDLRMLSPRAPGTNRLVVAGEEVAAPAPLEAPAMEVDEPGLDAGVMVFDRSLEWLHRRLPDVPISVVYIPAPLAIYKKAGSVMLYAIEPRQSGLTGTATPEAIDRNSVRLCRRVREVAIRHGAGFLDTTSALRAAAKDQPIHGPLDWDHPNEMGYRALAASMAAQSNDPGKIDICE